MNGSNARVFLANRLRRANHRRLFRRRAHIFGSVVTASALLILGGEPVWAKHIDIVAIGASNTAGNVVGSVNAYPAQLESMLRSKGYDVSVRNEGVSGNTTSAILERIGSAVPPGTALVIIEVPHVNDAKFPQAYLTYAQGEANFKAAVELMHARNIRVIRAQTGGIPVNEKANDGRHPGISGHHRIAARLLPQVIAALGSYRLSAR